MDSDNNSDETYNASDNNRDRSYNASDNDSDRSYNASDNDSEHSNSSNSYRSSSSRKRQISDPDSDSVQYRTHQKRMKYEKELASHKEHVKHEFQGLVNSVIGSLNNETNVILPGNSTQIEQNIAHSINVYQRPRTLLERNANALKERKFADVLFLAGKEEKKIPVNKFLLMCGSPVFEKMFSATIENGFIQEFHEYEGQKLPIVKIPDIEPEILLALFQFLYAELVYISNDNVLDILYAARKYEVEQLQNLCLNFVIINLGVEDAFELLTKIRFMDDIRLQFICWTTLERNAKKAVEIQNFFKMDHNFLCAFLSQENLQVDELVLYQQVIKWARAECFRQGLDESAENIRQVLGPALYLIRFPIMNHKEFTKIVAEQEILSDADVVSIYKFLSTKKVSDGLFFSTKKRCFKPNRDNVIEPTKNEIEMKIFKLEYYGGQKNYYLRPFRSIMESCKGRIGTLDTFLSKKVNIKRNSDCPIHHITLRNGETEGEIAWTIDLSGFLVKSIYVKLANLIDHCIVDAFVSFASKRFSIPNEKGEITIKESPMHGNYLEVRAKIIAKEGAFFSISNEFGKNCISIVKNNVPNLAIIVEFY